VLLGAHSQPDLATVFIEKARAELQKFSQKLHSQKFYGLAFRVKKHELQVKDPIES